MPSPDLLTPSMAASTIWSWAPSEPYGSPGSSKSRLSHRFAAWLPKWLKPWLWDDDKVRKIRIPSRFLDDVDAFTFIMCIFCKQTEVMYQHEGWYTNFSTVHEDTN